MVAAVQGSTRAEPACAACGGGTVVRYSLPHVWHAPDSGPYSVRWCGGCDLGMLWPRPPAGDLASWYGERYYTHRETSPSPRADGFFERLRAHLAWRLDRSDRVADHIPRSARRVCDVGCGSGRLLEILRERGHEVVGVDPDPAARRAAEAKGLTVHAGTAEDMPRDLWPFDAITMLQSLEHCMDPGGALRRTRAALRPGGWLAVEVPNNACAVARTSGAAWYHLDAGRHLNFFTPASLARMVEEAGFEVAATTFAQYEVQFHRARIEAEQEVWDLLRPSSPRPGSRGRWLVLASTAAASRSAKYELVGVVARAC